MGVAYFTLGFLAIAFPLILYFAHRWNEAHRKPRSASAGE